VTSRILFLGQGRATEGVAMGHVRVEHAIETGLPGVGRAFARRTVEVPPFSFWEGLLVRRFPGLGERDLYRLRWHLVRSLGARRLLRRHLRHGRPDVVLVTTDQVSLLLSDLQQEVPCVLSLDSTTIDWLRMLLSIGTDETPAELLPLEAMERRALRRAPLSIAWTETIRSRAQQLAPGARVEVLHPGLDLETFSPGRGTRAGGPFRVLFVGGAWERKGGNDLLRALGPLLGDAVHLDVVTSGEVSPREGMSVHRLGPASPELLELFRTSDVLRLPTYCDAVPWVVVEALACGLPVVASDVGSIAELVGEGGLTFRAGDLDALRDSVLRLADSPAERSAMAAAARAGAEARYDARVNTPRLFDLLDDVAHVA
jgi:glycosyltransferase involved in cell wall biosynthesis